MREIKANEVCALRACLAALAAHHNRVSVHFAGTYPNRPIEDTLEQFARALAAGSSRIAVIGGEGGVAGFCKVDCADGHGKLDYLIVLPEQRGRGHGAALMDWAMAALAQMGARESEVKVVDGNDAALRLYEKYGFRMNAHILLRGTQEP